LFQRGTLLLKMRILVVVLALTACGCGPASHANGIPEYSYQIVHAYPHDNQAFTEGLFYLDGFLYESTGLEGESSVRKVRLETGEVVQKNDLPAQYFGEGIVNWGDKLIQLTYKTEVGFVYGLGTFAVERSFTYPGEGWALTQDGKHIYMSDGTPQIRVWDPATLKETGRITVTDDTGPVMNVNELEWVKGEIYANIWTMDRIARIDPASGRVVGWIDLTGLLGSADRVTGDNGTDVLNGIAYDAKGDRLFVTGKRWPKLFQIRVVKKSDKT
jgi:glutaminyl-peptide cyclotransferase